MANCTEGPRVRWRRCCRCDAARRDARRALPRASIPNSRRGVELSMLELEGVVKRYRGAGEEVHAVDGVNLSVSAGETVSLVGPAGSGKTTLLLLIAALLQPDRGTIRFDGRDLTSE